MACTNTCKRPTPAQARCGACHTTMATVSDFDRHRRDGRCLDFAEIGLVEVDGLWATPEGHRSRQLDAAKLVEARAHRSGGASGESLGVIGGSGKGGASDAGSERRTR